MTSRRRSVEIVRIDATPMTRTSRTREPEVRDTSVHCWPLRQDYCHIAVRAEGRRVGYGSRVTRQSFRLVMRSAATGRIEASRTFCLEVGYDRMTGYASFELPVQMILLSEEEAYSLEVYEIADSASDPVMTSHMRFYDIERRSMLISRIYEPEGAYFTRTFAAWPDGREKLMEAPGGYCEMHIRLKTQMCNTSIKLPEIVAKVYYSTGDGESFALDINNVQSGDGVYDEYNHVEITVPMSTDFGDILMVELETLGYTFCNVTSRCTDNPAKGIIAEEYFRFGAAEDIESLSDKAGYNEMLDERARTGREDETKTADEEMPEDDKDEFDDLLDEFITRASRTITEPGDLTEDEEDEDEEDEENAEEEDEAIPGLNREKRAIDELDAMVGLEEVKEKIHSTAEVMKFFRMRRVKHLKVKPISLHSLFLGSPGTGKTTVAKMMGRIMNECGALSKGHIVVRERSHLVGQYYSSTHENTLKAIEEARGGVLFIDEAYQLYVPEDPKDPGHDVLDTLMTVLSDEEERDLMVILGGYTRKTLEMLELNPGLKSRFPECNHYTFADYTPEELLRIAEDYFLREEYLLTTEARFRLASKLEHDYRRAGESFANGRHVMTLIENRIIPSMARRAAMAVGNRPIDEELLMTVLPEDI